MEEWPVAIRIARKRSSSKAESIPVQPAVESALVKLGAATELIGSATADAVTAVAGTVGPVIGSVASSVGPAVDDARERLAPLVADARDRIAPVVADAKDRIGPAVDSAKDKIIPAAGVAVAAGKRRGQKAAVALGLVEEPKPSHKLRNVLILLGLGGLAAFVYTKLSGGKDADPAWTAGRDRAAAPTTAEPVPTPVPAPEPVSPLAEEGSTVEDNSDTAPTAPFPSEETVESTVPTTPDTPLEERSV
jgi:hypothetical protein